MLRVKISLRETFLIIAVAAMGLSLWRMHAATDKAMYDAQIARHIAGDWVSHYEFLERRVAVQERRVTYEEGIMAVYRAETPSQVRGRVIRIISWILTDLGQHALANYLFLLSFRAEYSSWVR